MKKTLVITLALVMAFASSAMAAVNFGGDFESTLQNDGFTFLKGDWTLSNSVNLNVSAASESEETGWSFEAKFGDLLGTVKLGEYKLALEDDYFKAWVWGEGKELQDKGTQFDLLKVAKKADDIRGRLEVPVMDLATITLDLAPKNNLYAFVDATIEDYNVGLAAARKGMTEDEPTDVVVGHGSAAVDLGDQAVNVKAAVGATLGDELGIAYGVGADTMITDELKIEGSFKGGNDKWNGDGGLTDKKELFAKATYTETEFQVSGSVTHELVAESNTIELGGKYRFSDAVAYGDLFHNDHWFKNDAPAVGVSTKLVDFKFDNVRVDVASPVLEDMIWARAYGVYKGEKDFEAGADARILATDKLTVKPAVDYKSEGKVVDVRTNADYKLGASDTTLGLTVQKVFTEEGFTDDDDNPVAKELIKASVKVSF